MSEKAADEEKATLFVNFDERSSNGSYANFVRYVRESFYYSLETLRVTLIVNAQNKSEMWEQEKIRGCRVGLQTETRFFVNYISENLPMARRKFK